MADSIESAMQQAYDAVSQNPDVRPVGSSPDTQPTEPTATTPDGIRPADTPSDLEKAAEVTEQPSGETPPVQPEKKLPEHIPYDRFQEVVKQRNETQQRFEEVQKYFAALTPQQKTILENPQLLDDPVRLNAFLYGEQKQQEVVPDFDTIEDPYEREIAIRDYRLRRDMDERLKSIEQRAQTFERGQMEERQQRANADAVIQVQRECAEIEAGKEFVGVSDPERKAIIEDAKSIARQNLSLSLMAAYKQTPHYARLLERHYTAKALGVQQAKRITATSGSISAGGGNAAPAAVNSIEEAYALAVQRYPGD